MSNIDKKLSALRKLIDKRNALNEKIKVMEGWFFEEVKCAALPAPPPAKRLSPAKAKELKARWKASTLRGSWRYP